MEESNEDPRVTPELYFLIAKFLSGGPLKETAKTLLKELESAEVLPRRLDWEGREHSQSYDELSSQYADMSWSRLVEVCTQALRLARLSGPAPTPKAILPAEPSKSTDLKVTAKLSLLSEGLVRPLPKYTPYKEDHSIVRRVARRELGFGCAAKVGGAGGKAIMSPRLLSGLQLQRRTLGHLSAVYCLLFDCTGRYVVTGADDLLVKVWSARDGRLLATLRGAGAEITDVCITGDGALLGAGSVERCVRVWRLDTAAPQAQLTHHTGTITAVHWSPQTSSDVRWLASTSTDGSVAFWTCSRSGQFLSQPVQYVERTRPGACHMICAAWSAGGAFLAAGSADHHVRLYQLEPGASPRRVLETPVHTDAVDSLCWARRGLRFVSGSKDGTAALWSLHAAQWRHTLLRCDPHGETTDNKRLKVTMVQWDSSDAYVVTAVSDCTIRVWCARTCVQVRVLTGHTDEAYVLEAHPYLAGVFLSAGHDGQLSVWDASTGETLATFNNKIEGQGSGAIFDAKWGGGTVIAASDSHGHLLLLGLGQGHKLFRQLPTELFFHTDYRPLVRDALGGALDEQTETPPHLMPPPFLVDVEGAPHPPHLQRLVPGRENLTLSQLIPVTGDDRDPLDMMIDALRRQNDEDAHLLNGMNPLFDGAGRSVWRGSGVRRTLGSWQRGSPLHNPHEFKPLVPPLPPAQLDQIEKQGTELYEMELQWYRRELRRRPVMINTAPRRRAPRPRPKPQPRTIPRVEPEPELSPESSGSDTSDVSVRLSADSRSSHSERLAYTTHDTDSSSRSGSRSDNSSSSKSSQYSDWEAGEKLAPPARARRRPVKQTKRYSPSTVAPKRSERVQPTASTSAAPAVPATTSAATSSVPSPTELPEAYRPGEWLTAVVPRKAPYYPQMGDHCVYFRVGHQRYFEAVSEKDVYKLNPRDKPWERTQINDCEPVKVVGIKYVIRPPRVACLRLASLRGRRSFTVRYHDMPDVIDFLVPMQQYVAAQNRGWTQGDRFRCMIDDSWWTGIILETSGPADASEDWDAAASYFLSLRVRWDNGEMERLSPWDLEPLDPQRLPSEPGGAVPVLPHELEAVLYRAEPEEWPPTGDRAEACRTIARHIEQVMTLSVAEPFVAPVDLQLYPTYALVVPYPIDLSTIKARFDNLFYRRAAAAQFDVRYLASNAEQFNRVHSPIVRQARLVTELLLHIITFWHTVDVVAKYHDLAANYHSSDEETQPLSKHKSRRRRSCNNKQPDWQDACSKLLSSLLASPDSEPFREPVNLLQAPDYHAVISHPMDLATVHKKLESGEYSNQQQFATDVRLIFHNSRQYNTNKRSRIYSMTVRLSALFAALWSRVPLQSRRSTRPARHSRRIRPDSERNGNTHVNGDADPSSRLSDPSDSSEDEALAMTSRRARERVQRYRQNSDSLDSDTPLNKHKKGKGVGKKSKVNTTVPEPSTSSRENVREEEEVPRNGVTSGSDTSGTEEYTNIEVLEEELVEDDVELTYDDNWSERARARDSSHDGSSSGSIVYTNIEVLDEELIEDDADWSEQARARKSYHNSTPASARKRRRIPSSGSSARSHRTRRISRGKRPSKQKRTRERITDGSSSSSTSAEGGPPADNHRYESDHSYHPRFSTDDDAPLHLIRQRQEVTGEDGAGPSNPRRNKKGRVRLRKRRTPTRKYNEDSEDDSIAAISKRLRATNTPRLAQLLANRRARQSGAPPLPALAAHTADHNYFNGHAQPQPLNGGAGTSATPERLPVSISSRGRVRKLTAKARGLLRD